MGKTSTIANKAIPITNTTQTIIENPDVKIVDNTIKFQKLNKEFVKKTQTFRRYLYLLKYSIDNKQSFLENTYNNESDIQINKNLIIKNELNKMGKVFDKHFNFMHKFMVTTFNYDTKYYKHNEPYLTHQKYYKRQIKEYFIGVKFIRNVLMKPLKFPGDFKTMNLIYDNCIEGDSMFYELVAKYVMSEPIPNSTRHRKPYIIKKINKLKNNDTVLNIGSGPARETKEIIENPSSPNLEFTLIDFNQESLNYVENTIIKNNKSKKNNIKLINSDILNIKNLNIPKQKLIYSLGLFDYLRDGQFVTLCKQIFNLVDKNGSMIIGNLSNNNKSRPFMELIGEWYLCYRNENKLSELAEKCGFQKYSIEKDPNGVQLYLIVHKD